MEQGKVLLIIVAVTVVLAAVIGIGIWLFYPRDEEAAGSLAQGLTESTGFEWEPLDYLSGEGGLPELGETPEEEPDEFEVTYGVAEETETSIETQTLSPPTGPGVSGDADIGPDSGRPSTGRQPGSGLIVEDRPATEGASVTTAPTASRPAARETVSAPKAETPPAGVRAAADTEPTRAAAGAPAARPDVTSRSYWVQVISSPNRDTVDQAQRTLEEHQLETRILTKQINEKTYYRLRLGPFAVRPEAEKFLAWVQEIEGFSGSMIFVDYSTPTIAAVAR